VLCLFESSDLVAGGSIPEGVDTFFFCHYFSVYVWWGNLYHLCFICSHIKHCYLPRTCYVRYVSYVPESVTAVNDTRSYIGRVIWSVYFD